jgi:hypothetical protein
MKKICVSIETKDFKDGMKSMPDYIRKETLAFIQELIDAENNFNPSDKTKDKEEKSFPRQDFGNTLSAQDNRNIFSLKTKYRFRFVAAVIEDQNTKSYVWFFADTHEKYNTKIQNRTKELRQKENQLSESQKVEDEKIEQITKFHQQKKQKEKDALNNNNGNNGYENGSGNWNKNSYKKEQVSQNIEQMRQESQGYNNGKKKRHKG